MPDLLPREGLHKALRTHTHLFVNETLTVINPTTSISLHFPPQNGAVELDRVLSGMLNHESATQA